MISLATTRSYGLVIGLALTSMQCDRPAHTQPNTPSPTVSRDAAQRRSTQGHPVRIPTADGFTLVGEFATEGTQPCVILVHQLSSTRHEWDPLVSLLREQSPPFCTLTFDLRGHGESTTHATRGMVHWQSFGSDPAQWAGVVEDVRAAVLMVQREHVPIVLVGSSIGSSAVVRVAAESLALDGSAGKDPALAADISSIVLLSPGLSYRGVRTLDAMQSWLQAGRPAFVIAAQADSDSWATLDAFERASQPSNTLRIERVTGSDPAHGVALAQLRTNLWSQIAEWVRHPTAQQPSPKPQSAGVDASTGSDASMLDSTLGVR